MINRYGDAVEKKWIKWLKEEGKITCEGRHPSTKKL